jgi:hypothetical protein
LQPLTGPAADDERELASLQADFPAYEFWREKSHRGVRYVACSQRLDQNPHTVITADLGELRAALGGVPPSSPPADTPASSAHLPVNPQPWLWRALLWRAWPEGARRHAKSRHAR